MVDTLVIDLILLALALIVAVATVLVRNLLAAAALLSIYSLIMALVWSNMYALDVAFTEASVGAGISTILMIGALVITGTREKAQKVVHWPSLLIVLLVGAALCYGTTDMPKFGDANAPVNNRVADVYIQQDLGKPDHAGQPGGWDLDLRDPRTDPRGHAIAPAPLAPGEEAPAVRLGNPDLPTHGDFSHHTPNLVTSVIVAYRGYDTMFETAVIFTAGISVIILLRRRETKPAMPATVASKTPVRPEVGP